MANSTSHTRGPAPGRRSCMVGSGVIGPNAGTEGGVSAGPILREGEAGGC
jgi:hypothetical protein